jgi:inosose dehydratase
MTRPAPTWLPEGVHLGVAPICWTNDILLDLGGDIPLETCLAEAAAAGYQGIELGRLFPRDARTLRPLLDGYGLDLVSGWYSGFLADRDVEEEWRAARPHVQLLQAMGCAVLVYGECGRMPGSAPLDEPLSRSPALGSEEWADYAERVTTFAERLRNEGLQLAYHHHLMMVVENGDEIDRFMAAAGPAVGLLLDTGHATAAGIDYRRLIDRYGTRIAHVHLKSIRQDVLAEVRANDLSFNEAVRRGVFTVPGDGAVDLSPIAHFAQGGFRGWLVVEAEQRPEPIPPSARVSAAFRHLEARFSSEREGSCAISGA